MWQPDIEGLAGQLSHDFGLPIDAVAKPLSGGWPAFELRPADIPREISFGVGVVLGWRSITLSLTPGAFAGPLVAAMGEADDGARQTFVALAKVCIGARAGVSLEVDGKSLDPLQAGDWPTDWRRVSLVLARSPAAVNTEDHGENDRELSVWTHRYLSLAMALMPVEELEPNSVLNPEGLPEGAKVRVEANRYERSRINRAACIELQGDSCLACDFNFGETYGEAGRGFIHVHHVTPVSQIGAGYRVNPATDLVPLCPNCHAMAHHFDPPASIEQLRKLRTT
ncbi:HNH endonuclease [Sphingomonas sp. MMS24-J45]|uniref:HNH endonuclease n=1 Tax=Sphingomonas sp. MMS24-J45 TaxID=3238806 RepID=UPI00384B24C5